MLYTLRPFKVVKNCKLSCANICKRHKEATNIKYKHMILIQFSYDYYFKFKLLMYFF